MDPRTGDTMPLPVVETVATPAAPEEATVALPAEPVAPAAALPAEPVPPGPGRRRDLTPLVLGLLCAAAVLALALSALAFARRGSPAAPTRPSGSEATSTTGGTVDAPAAPATTSAPAASSRTTAAPAGPAAVPAPAPGGRKGKGGKQHD